MDAVTMYRALNGQVYADPQQALAMDFEAMREHLIWRIRQMSLLPNPYTRTAEDVRLCFEQCRTQFNDLREKAKEFHAARQQAEAKDVPTPEAAANVVNFEERRAA